MPFLSKAQRRKFYHLKAIGKMDQSTIDEWEAETPKNIPQRLHKKAGDNMNTFWLGFQKRAAENFVSANNTGAAPGAPEKLLKWNEQGGVDPR